MKRSILVCALTLGLLLPLTAAADVMEGMKKDSMGSMESMPKKTMTVQGAGVIKAIDAKQVQVTLAHDPIPALKWPAMTMSFKVANPNLLKGLSVGQQVQFTLQGSGMEQVITAMTVSR